MIRSIASFSIGLSFAVAASGAQSQAMPTGPVPGSGDATKISQGTAASQSDYNHLIGSGNAKSSATSDDRRPSHSSTAVPATVADLRTGSAVRDVKGVSVGAVSQVDPDGVVVDTGVTKIKVPASAFGKDDHGLLLSITAARFNELIAQAKAAH